MSEAQKKMEDLFIPVGRFNDMHTSFCIHLSKFLEFQRQILEETSKSVKFDG